MAVVAVFVVLVLLLSPLPQGAASSGLRPLGSPTLHLPASAAPSAPVPGATHPAVLRGVFAPPALSTLAVPATAGGPLSSRPLAGGVTVGKAFPGISYTNSSCSCAPPDVQDAVGATEVMEMVNLEGKVWTKAGAVVSSFTLSSFFLTGSDFISDPKVLYDNLSGRWFASILDVTNGTIHVAVSKNGSASGLWFVYFVGGSPAGDFPDQPILGVSSGLVVLGGNQYVYATSAFVGGQVWALNKSSMLTGATTYFTSFGPHASWFSMHPVHSISATSKEYVVMTTGTKTVDVFNLTGRPSLTTSAHLSPATALTVATFSVPPAAPQKGTTKKVDTSDNRVQDAAWRANTLWMTYDTGCKPTGDATTRACVEVLELSTLGTPHSVQDVLLNKSKTYLFYGSLGMDGALNVVVSFGYSNSSVFPGFDATAHLSAGAPGSHLAFTTLVKGTASATVACNALTVCRWGDYYGAGADPSGPYLWVAGEYGTTTTHWSTYLAQIRA
ncbi:MAG: hypothetical protein L3K23_06185 [Thermoplasmata archaeon]|nr:hypothetical protein [Thermoplasmata archaeon]